MEAGLAVVLGVAKAVVAEGEAFPCRLEAEAGEVVLGRHVAALAVFVDVVTDVDEGVVVADVCCFGVGVEVFGGDVGAAEDSEFCLTGRAGRESFGFSHRGNNGAAVHAEAEVVGAVCGEAGRDDLDGVVLCGLSADGAARLESGEGAGGGEFPAYGNGIGVGRGDASPEHHGIGHRSTGGNPVDEGGVRREGKGTGGKQQGGGEQFHGKSHAASSATGFNDRAVTVPLRAEL